MVSAHVRSSTPFPRPDVSSAALGFRADVESVARMWVAAAYDDLRRAGPDRAKQVRRILDGYVLPWFAPQTTTVGDISYFMVHDWLLHLVGRGQGEPAVPAPAEGLDAPRPDPAVARSRRPISQPRPLSLPECARIAAHLHPVHQLVLWLQRVMGLRISEAFGILIDDVVDLGNRSATGEKPGRQALPGPRR